MADILRGEIYWADLQPVRGHEQGGIRPVLIISHDLFNARSGTVIALAITGQPQRVGFPLAWPVPGQTLPRPSWVKVSQIRTLSTERLGSCIGQIGEQDVAHLVDGLLELIG